MSEEKVYKGRCYCGACTYEVKAKKPLQSILCHCNECKLSHSAAVYYVVYVSGDNFKLTSGEPTFWIPKTMADFEKPSSGKLARAFCPTCGCRICNRIRATPEEAAATGQLPEGFKGEVCAQP
eukprot:TRINITY_DN66721_c5_g2_i1.p1 TRINITY_DN66721_c5_g2~~TRINITY_DN66721_c5_g2_i1.p1  ORF type:complete len:123 (-),score=20.44 TRINITY_DN66721_c5_g2_i1:124-492(-)